MQILYNKSTSPSFNLALEEYMFLEKKAEVIMLWRNAKAVIVGKNQNTIEEIDTEYVKENDIKVIRRLTGGGAVFHDLGNVNFTVIKRIEEGEFNNYEKFTKPVCDFLKTLGVNAYLEGRNDILVEDKKISGNAQASKNGMILHHGTILYNADMSYLQKALLPKDRIVSSRAVPSRRREVTNIASHLNAVPPVEEFTQQLYNYFLHNTPDIEEYVLTDKDLTAVNKLDTEKYSTWNWNFGHSPQYEYRHKIRYDFGYIDLGFNVKDGIICDVKIYTDGFGVKDITELESALVNTKHKAEDLTSALKDIKLGDYISGLEQDIFLDMFF